jgi:hypothetical protein
MVLQMMGSDLMGRPLLIDVLAFFLNPTVVFLHIFLAVRFLIYAIFLDPHQNFNGDWQAFFMRNLEDIVHFKCPL